MQKETDVLAQTVDRRDHLTRGDLRLELKVKNNVLWHAIFDRYRSVAALCKAVPQLRTRETQVSNLLRFKVSPFKKAWVKDCGWVRTHEYQRVCHDLAEALGVLMEDLFPRHLYENLVGGETEKVVEVVSFSALPRAVRREIRALPAPAETDPEEQLEKNELRREVHSSLECLTPRQRQMLELRFGLEDGIERTPREIAAMLNVTRAYVSDTVQKAVHKLRERRVRRNLRPFLKEL